MDLSLLKKLIKMVEQSEITDFTVQEGELKVRISKNSHHESHVQYQPVSEFRPAPGGLQAPPHPTIESIHATSQHEQSQTKFHEIKSPIVGTFYRAPAPDADPYIQVGDVVSSGTVLCIVEAMKLMNEIECDVSGKIVKILVENATPVEYNQPLFLIETV